MRKFLLVFSMVVLCCLVNQGQTLAAGEQSVLEQIGRDGDCLITNSVAQKMSEDAFKFNRIEAIDNVALMDKDGKFIFYDCDANGFWNQTQEFELEDVGTMHLVSSDTAVFKGSYSSSYDGVLYVASRDDNGVWRQPQNIGGYYHVISGDTMVVAKEYGFYAPSCSLQVYIRDTDGVWQASQTINFAIEHVHKIETEPCPYKPAAIWKNFLIVTSCGYGAYICKLGTDGKWAFATRLQDPEGDSDSLFGQYVLASDNYVYFKTRSGTYEYEYTANGTWRQNSKVSARFEQVSGDYAIAEKDDAIYIYERDQTGVWRHKQELTAIAGKNDIYYSLVLKGNYAGFISYGQYPNDGDSTSYVFERNRNGIWQLRVQSIQPWIDVMGAGELEFYNNGAVNAERCVYMYQLNLTNWLTIPGDRKYLVFKVAKNSIIESADVIGDKIRFEAVGYARDGVDSDVLVEDVRQLTLDQAKYAEDFDHVYYIVNVAELKTAFAEAYNSDFQIAAPGSGYGKYAQINLRVRYDAPVMGNSLEDVYVTDGGTIINVQPNLGGATVSWTEIDADAAAQLVGYQVDYTETPAAPQKGIDDLPIIKVPYETKSNLRASKAYYVWVRVVNSPNKVGSWACSVFSPKPNVSAFVTEECASTATTSGRKPQYEIKLKVKDVDVAQYIIERQEYNKPETLITVNTLPDKVMSANKFFCSGGSGLIKHGKYEYFVYTKNALGEFSERSTPVVMNVQNLPPRECIVMRGWKEIEVNDQLSLRLGLKADLEGDPLTYRLYIRTPGATDATQIASWSPETDYLEVNVPYTFNDKTSYEWQIRCIEKDNPYGAGEYTNKEWSTTKIDTDALVIVATNDTSISSSAYKFWSTKKQPVSFTIEKNPEKTYHTYQWNFGDGSMATGLSATHAYTDLTPQAPYQVQVTALDEAGVQHVGAIDMSIINTYKGKLYDHEEWSGTPMIESEVVVPAGLTLTLMPGSKLQMQAGSSLRIYGTLRAEDANGGSTITRQKEDLWKGIIFEGSGSGTLRGVTISYAETGITAAADTGIISLNEVKLIGNQTGLDFFTGILTANNCLFQSNTAYGILVEDEIYPALTQCTFNGNKQHYVDSYGLLTEDDVNQCPGGGGNVFQD